MTSRFSRLSVALVLPAAVLVGHAVGYGTASHGDDAALHGYLPAAAVFAVLLATAGVLGVLLVGTSGRPMSRQVSTLGASQAAAFLLMELVEHGMAGGGPASALESPAVWIGLAAQVGISFLAVLLLSSAATTGLRLVEVLRRLPMVRVEPWERLPWPSASPLRPAVVGAVAARGPPPR